MAAGTVAPSRLYEADGARDSSKDATMPDSEQTVWLARAIVGIYSDSGLGMVALPEH
jgi:hypothetical protein